jgi:hypothetical protein
MYPVSILSSQVSTYLYYFYNVVVHRVDHVIEWITFPDPTTSKLKLLNHNTLN